MDSSKGATGPRRVSPGDLVPRLASLTMRQREILELVQLGLTNAEIARHLVISEGTVRKHIENAFAKLEVHSRTQASAILSAARVLPPMPAAPDRDPDLPRYLTSFVARQGEIDRLTEVLAGARLLTLTGPGGVGKTRLALRLASEVSADYDDGVRFADFSGLADQSLVPHAVAAQLGIREQPGYAALDTLIHYLKSKRLLLLLDNCEHLLTACAALSDELLRRCPALQILVTSRQSLRVDGETVHSVPPLSVPMTDHLPHAEGLMDWEAVRLMVDRVRSGAPSFRITKDNAGLVVQICRQLDGIPLALELAAALVRTRPLDLIARGLNDRFQLLVVGSRTAVPRHQTLRATVDWSHDLLSDAERALLRRLSVFAGGFSAGAAERVCAGEYDGLAVVDILGDLVDKSLVMLDGEGEGRYRLLDTVRDYARQRLKESGEEADLQARHGSWYLAVAEGAEQHLYGGPQQAEALVRLDREHDNLRAALEWSRRQPAAAAGTQDAWLRLATSLWRFWEIRGHLTEGRGWLEPALTRTSGEVSELRANSLTGAGILAFMQGDYGAASSLHEESLALHRQLGSGRSVALAVSNLGNVAIELRDFERARSCHEEAAVLHRTMGNAPEEAGAWLHLAEVADQMGDAPGATALFEKALTTLEGEAERATHARERAFARWMLSYGLSMHAVARLRNGDLELARSLALRSLFLYRDAGDAREGTRVLALIAEIADRQGDPASAASLLLEALSTRVAMGDRPGMAATLERFAELAARTDAESAARLLGSAEALREQMGTPLPFRDRERHERLRSTLTDRMGVQRYDQLFEEGRRSSLATSVAQATAMTRLTASSGPP